MKYMRFSADYLRPALSNIDGSAGDGALFDLLSEQLNNDIEEWNENYGVIVPMSPSERNASRSLISSLDDIGIDLAKRIEGELAPAKVVYFSEGLLRQL